ncbi:DUF6596 domain-containing protein [Microbispora sp. H11081]|uniref:DUF6596 domain-containing protein n=1 Tax=Microbispora sp. H11081 TaxID=2729107 RepID=UPI001B8D44EA|nr:DUF6596 domain-containing protein [Microbispora sp. H11081]
MALTLRSLAGLNTAEIARAFLVGEQAMAKRLTRAKRKIRHAGIPYRVPPAHLLPECLPAVLAVLYLLFNEGYSATSGDDLVRHDLAAEAIRLARVLVRLMPDEPEAAGLLALMLLHHARRATRLDGALGRGQPGALPVQAAIAACHATAAWAVRPRRPAPTGRPPASRPPRPSAATSPAGRRRLVARDGVPLSGAAQDLVLVLCGRLLPEGRLRGEPAARFTRFVR